MTPAYGMAEMAVGISSHDPAAGLRVRWSRATT